MGKLQVVVGGQYGSESKGAVTAHLARQTPLAAIVRVAGPNAGHTAYDDEGRAWALRQIPVGGVVDFGADLYIAAGSEIDPPVLLDEITRLEAAGIPVRERLYIDEQATVITNMHKILENRAGNTNLVERVGSTGKGIGAARADRLMRQAQTWGQYWATMPKDPDPARRVFPAPVSNTAYDLNLRLVSGGDVIIEGTQGYGLGLHAGHYPQCTSSDCRAIDFLAMAGIAPWIVGVEFEVWLVVRTFPIRVAGNSGPLLGETTWGDLGLPEERTTVTKKVRRVGQFDWDLLDRAVTANGGAPHVKIALAMADQMFHEMVGRDGRLIVQPVAPGGKRPPRFSPALDAFIEDIETRTGCMVAYVGTGPNSRVWL